LFTIAFIWTDDTKTASYVALVYNLLQIIIYFFHERLWNSIQWGKTKGLFIEMTGMSGAGKSTLAAAVAQRLRKKGYKIEILDGDEYRRGLCNDLGFSKKDRNENIRRLGFVSKVLTRNNIISIIAAINPYEEVRKELKNKYKNVKIVHVKCDLQTLICRDTKGLYKKAMLPDEHPDKIYNFTGISDPYEPPNNADLVIETNKTNINQSIKELENFILENIT